MFYSRDELFIFGAGAQGRVVADAASRQGYTVCGFIDCAVPIGMTIWRDKRVVSNGLITFKNRDFFCTNLVIAVGDNSIRKHIFEEAVESWFYMVTIVHPDAIISEEAYIGKGSVVLAGAIIGTGASVGDNAIINTKASIDHDCVIGNHTHICPGATLAGNVVVEDGSQVSVGCSVRDNVCIGENSLIGVGASVVNDISNNVVAYGCPAKKVRKK